jgi:broad specificity phosphatase PhoE
LENGESPYEGEIRSVNKLYEIILDRANDPECKSIVLVLHGRLLRIVLASILHRDLTRMGDFTHHNTTVNIVDAFISPATDCEEKKVRKYSRAGHSDRVEFLGVLFDSYSHLIGDASPL